LDPVQAFGKEAHRFDLSFRSFVFAGLFGAALKPNAARTLRRTAAKHNMLASCSRARGAFAPATAVASSALITRCVENTYNFQIFAKLELTRDRHIPSKSRPQERVVLAFDHAGARFARKE
jgi:hypothetical protein